MDQNQSLVAALRNGTIINNTACETGEVVIVKKDCTTQTRVPRVDSIVSDARAFAQAGSCLWQDTIVNPLTTPVFSIFGVGRLLYGNTPGYAGVLNLPGDYAGDNPAVTDDKSEFVPTIGVPKLQEFNAFNNGRSTYWSYVDVTVSGETQAAIDAQFQQSFNPVSIDANNDSCARKGKKLFCFLCPDNSSGSGANNIRRFQNFGGLPLAFGPDTGYTYRINPGMSVTFEASIAAEGLGDNLIDCNGMPLTGPPVIQTTAV